MNIQLNPIGLVHNDLSNSHKGNWRETISIIELVEPFTEASLRGLNEFSHAEIIFFFDKVPEDKIQTGEGHPRNNTKWPAVGIFAQRGFNRPNRLGATIVRILSVNERSLTVMGLDALDGSPVIDIKPVMHEFLPPNKDVQQPEWADELMQRYWKNKEMK